MPESLHRGPRFQSATALPTAPGSRVLMPELLGRVLALARRGVEASQAEVAKRTGLPASTVSKLELGVVSAAVHHLDALAEAYRGLAEARGVEVPWEGWQLHRVATAVAEALAEEGIACIWERRDLVAEDDERYLRGRELTVRVRRAWPREWRGRA
jgi:transcriptional regulator with XRE-family HTH domain